MAKWPTTDEWVERIGNKVLNEYVYRGRTLKEWIDLIAKGKCVVFPADATNGDIIQNVCSMWIDYYGTDVEVTVSKEDWTAPYGKVRTTKAGDTDGNN